MSVAKTEERKQIEKRLRKLGASVRAAREELDTANDAHANLLSQVRGLEKRLKEIRPRAVTVSDHAVLRYLERESGVDVQAIKDSILQSPALAGFVEMSGGSGKMPINGYQVVMKNYTVVTIQ